MDKDILPTDIAARAESLGRALCAWFAKNQRDLPWRHTRDPYHIWVSEIMLQQTRVDTVIAYYHRFLTQFPTVEALAAAPLEAVLKAWEGLGYYSRARNLHRGAVFVRDQYGGRLPADFAALARIPGVGRYTAGAIASIAFHQPVPAMDGNVARVISRLFAIEDPVDRPDVRRRVEALAVRMIPPGESSACNQGLMELGALICLPGEPRCTGCPLSGACEGREKGLEKRLPVKAEKKPPVPVHRAVMLVRRGEEWLIRRRPEGGLLAGLWEFPGLDLPEGTDGRAAVATWLLGSGLGSPKLTPAGRADHVFTHRVWHMEGWRADVAEDAPAPPGCRWAGQEEMSGLPFPAAMGYFLRRVRGGEG